MHIPTKRLSNGFVLPVYGLGLWQVGGRHDIDTSRDTQEIKAIQAAIELGVTHIDTAEMYGKGHAEELLGRALKGYDRKKLLIASKVLPENQKRDDLLRSFEASIKRIGTDYLDLYMLHFFPKPGINIAETMKAMDELVAQGAVKHIGLSNCSVNRFKEAQKYTQNKIVCNQVHYNVEYREAAIRGVVDYCRQNDVVLVAWRPLQKGTLLQVPFLTQIGEKYGKTPAQVAINWLVSQKNVVTLAKTSSIEHLKENLGAIDWSLDQEDAECISREYPDQKQRSDAGPLDYEASVEP